MLMKNNTTMNKRLRQSHWSQYKKQQTWVEIDSKGLVSKDIRIHRLDHFWENIEEKNPGGGGGRLVITIKIQRKKKE